MRIFKFLFFLLFLTGTGQQIYAQLTCATDEVQRHLLQTDPAYKKAVELRDARWKQYNQNKKANGYNRVMSGDSIYEIPVVFHVIHTGQAIGTTQNPSDSTLIAKIANLNSIFAANYNAGSINTTESVDIPIRFTLARRTPDCQATNGINRVDGSAVPGYSTFGLSFPGSGNPGADETAIMSLSNWPRSSYLNIWIVTQIQGAGGYAGVINGVFIAGIDEYLLAHEIGHYLGLLHTFEGAVSGTSCPNNSNCTTDGDGVCDTEPHYLTGCQTGINPCTNQPWGPVIRNFMNYSNYSCLGIFTTGQKEKMLFEFDYWNSSIKTSLGGLPPGIDPIVIPSPVSACVPAGIINPGNTANIGPTSVILEDIEVHNEGYSFDNYQFYIDHTIPPATSCLLQQPNIVAHLTIGQAYTILVTTKSSRQNVRGWIDFNNDGTFQPSELIISSDGQINGDETHTATFSVPATGVTTCTSLRMRIGADAWGYPAPQPCANLEFGQVEDFIVVIEDPIMPLPSVSIAANTTNLICEGTNVIFTATVVSGGSNPSYQWKKNGINVGTNNSTYTNAALVDGDIINCVVTTSGNCPAYPIVASNLITMKVSPSPPSVNITAKPGTSVCGGSNVIFAASPTNGGSSPSYQWKKNGVNVGTNNSTFVSNGIANGDIINCVMTIQETCPASQTATSNAITMIVGSPPPGTVIIPSPVVACVPTGQFGPWASNNYGPLDVQLADMLVHTQGNHGDGDKYYVDHTIPTMPDCLQNQPVAHLKPDSTYIISVSTALGGYPQNVRGWIDYNNDGFFQDTELIISSNGTATTQFHTATFTVPASGIVTCNTLRMRIISDFSDNTSPQPCGMLIYGQAEDFIVIIQDPAIPAPSVNIAASPAGTICAGTNVTFTATTVNGGSNPIYQWKLNGNNVGTNNSIYSTNVLTNGDIISCVLTSSDLCATTPTDTSNAITISVNPVVTPSVSISTNTSGAICAGTNVIFTATPVNGGNNPGYQWKLNGNNVGSNSSTYSNSTLSNGDVITCLLTSSESCTMSATATSNAISLMVNPVIIPSVSIVANPSGAICNGTNVTFTATPVNGGSNPGYQWKKNGVNAGSSSTTYTDAGLTNGDIITCTLTSNAPCANPSSVTSSGIAITVNANPDTPTITAGGSTVFCEGGSVVLTSSAASGNQWFKNGNAISGQNGTTYTATTSGSYTVRVINAFNCLATSAITVVTVYAIPPKPTITLTGGQLSSSAATGNQWFKDGVAIAGATGQTYLPGASGNYTVQVTLNGCPSPMSDAINITITAVNDPVLQGAVIISPNPVNDIINIRVGSNRRITARLYDITGKKLLVQKEIIGNAQLSVNHLAQGLYIIYVMDETTKKSFTKLLFKK